jgi:hypothetical protein
MTGLLVVSEHPVEHAPRGLVGAGPLSLQFSTCRVSLKK